MKRGPEELPLTQSQGRRPRAPGRHGAGAAERSYPTPRSGACQEELPHVQGQGGSREEIPLVRGREQRLRFAGAAVKRYPSSKVRETQVRG